MPLALLGGFFALSTALTALPILRFAFRRSVGTGFMVLLIPFYMLHFAFSQFEHPRKPWIVSTWIVALVLTAVCFGLVETVARSAMSIPPA